MPSFLKKFTASGITARLFELIAEMPEDKKKELLVFIGDQRKYERMPYLMQVSYETETDGFTDFMLDISPGGIFLETMEDLFIGQKLQMTFQFKNEKEPFVITGNVVWKGSNGAGIQFSFDSQEQKESIKERIERLG